METAWVDSHQDTVQKLVNAFVRTLRYIGAHDAAEIADQMPTDFYVGDKVMYVSALAAGKAMFTTDGRMPEGGPENVLAVLSMFMPGVRGATIDLGRTYTNVFADRANARK